MDKKELLFSIIVPVYKVESFIHQCVDSIVNQSYQNLEIILVDDGSPDHCGAICEEYAKTDSRIKVIHKENGGLVSARKAGAQVCTGDYVLNVDSDDFVDLDLVEKIAGIIKEHHPDVVAFDCLRYFNGETELLANQVRRGLYLQDNLPELQKKLIMDEENQSVFLYTVWSKAIKKELYVPYQMAVWDEIVHGEDVAVTAPVIAHSKSVYVADLSGYYYRVNPNSITNYFRPSEMKEQNLLASFLSEAMGPDYQSRIDNYMLFKYTDFLNRAIKNCEKYSDFQEIISQSLNDELKAHLDRANPRHPRIAARIQGLFVKKQWFSVFWHLCRAKNWVLRRKGIS